MKKILFLFALSFFLHSQTSAQTQAVTTSPKSTDTTLVTAPLNLKNKIVQFINKAKATVFGAFEAKQNHKETLDDALNENFKEKTKKKPVALFETEQTKKIVKDVEELEKKRNQELEKYSK